MRLLPDIPETISGIPDGPPRYSAAPSLHLVNGASICPKPIDWLWNGWLAAGKLHVMAGAPGTGKTTIALALAAALTTGGRWPDGSRVAKAGGVLIWSGEDDPTDTLAPRLIACGADMRLTHFVGSMTERDERRPFDPARDMDALADAVRRVGSARLLICDPVVSAVTGDSHKNTEVRRALQPLVDLGLEAGCAILGISHFSKGTQGRDPTERVAGSLAFGALARVVIATAKVQDDASEHAGRRIMARTKSNIGPDDGAFAYDLEQIELADHPGVRASRVLWGDAIDGSAREILAAADRSSADDADGGERADAEQFLRDLLADGPVPSRQVRIDADGAGYSWATIRRAQKSLGVEAIKEGQPGRSQRWLWSLSSGAASPKALKKSEDAQQNNVSTFGKSEHLRGDTSTAKQLQDTSPDEGRPSWLPGDAETF